jgi:hypothetical protein
MKTLAGIAMTGLTAVLLPAAILPAAGPAQSARVVFAESPDPSQLPEGLSIESWDGHFAMLQGVDAAAARRLYAWGAILVYPVRPSGCVFPPAHKKNRTARGHRPVYVKARVGRGRHPALYGRSERRSAHRIFHGFIFPDCVDDGGNSRGNKHDRNQASHQSKRRIHHRHLPQVRVGAGFHDAVIS